MAWGQPMIKLQRGTPITIATPTIPTRRGTPIYAQPGQPLRAGQKYAPQISIKQATRRPIPRFGSKEAAARWHIANPQPGRLQNLINKVTGATPENPLQIPIQFQHQVEVKPDVTLRNTILLVAGIGAAAYMFTR